jgi:amidase
MHVIPFAEYDRFDGLGLAKLVKDGKITAAELCEEAIRRTESLNPKLNAIVTKTYELARESAKRADTDARFCGVPFLLKDVHHALKGAPMSCGCELLKTFIPQYDAEIVTRFKQSGVIIIGKSNTPEFKLAYITEPKAFGPTRNPWNIEYSSGGSSGGSAAAVAAGIVPFASATDEGGSIRVPASYCGLFGLKPSRGRTPLGPKFDEEWDGLSCSHVITRSVRDSAAMLDAVSGPENGAPHSIGGNTRPYVEEVHADQKPLRIAFHARQIYGMKPHPECIRAVEHTCKLLENLGHHVEEAVPDYVEEEAALNWSIVAIANLNVLMDRLVNVYGQAAVRRGVELPTLAFDSLGRHMKVVEFVKAKARWRELAVIMDRMLTRYDLLLTPTLGQPPVRVGSQKPSSSDEFSMKLISSGFGRVLLSNRTLTYSILEESINKAMSGQMPYTLIANITGQPAISVPLHWTQNGLPCGVQFLGRYGDEATLLRLAGQLERAQPWFEKRPAVTNRSASSCATM